MSWDYSDRQEVISALKGLKANSDKSLATQDKIADAFTRMASAMEKLAKEVASLREDLKPEELDKKKLPAPLSGATP